MTAGPLLSRRPSFGDIFGTMSRRWQSTPGWARWLVYALVLVAAFLLPAPGIGRVMTPDSDWASVLFFPIGIYVLLAIGLNVVVGFAGLLDLGYVAFFAIGAYSMAILGVRYHLSFWEILPIGIGLSMVAGVILGTPTLRLRGDYLAIVTLGFGEIVRVTANNLAYTGGPRGISGIPHPPSVSGVAALNYESFLNAKPYYYLVLVLIVLVIVVAKRLENSRVGRSWAALREDEDAAELMGVPTLKFKLWAFAIGAAIGGGAGAVYAAKTISITPDIFPFTFSALILAAVVLGGSGNLPGVVLGAFLVAWLPERFRGLVEYRTLIFGAVLVIIMILRPEGLLPSRRRRAELTEGSGGMGPLGGEVGPAATQRVEVET